MKKNLRVIFYGNQGNIGFRFVTWLRARGIKATLLLDSGLDHSRSKPEWEEPDILGNYPDWIKEFKGRFYNHLFPAHEVVEESNKCDVVLTCGSYVVSALRLKVPVLFLPVGFDITALPFSAKSLQAELLSYLYRRRIMNVSRVMTQQENCVWAARLLGVSDRVIRYPFPVDVKGIEQLKDHNLLVELEKHYSKYDLVLFNPSRKNLEPTKVDYKGTEKLLYVLKKLIRDNPSLKVKFITTIFGNNSSEYCKMVDRLNLTKYCDYIEHLPLPKLHAYMSLKNVVVCNQFNNMRNNALGGITREALSLGAIVMTALDVNSPSFLEAYGPGCPLVSAFETEDILMAINMLLQCSQEKRHSLQQKATEWAYRYLHWENRIDELIKVLYEVATEQE